MKKTAKLSALPVEDQKLVLNLCEKHTYPEVADLLAKPRDQGGLDLETNRSALSRFCIQNGWLHTNTGLVQQFIEILQAQTGTPEILPHLTQLMGQFAFLLMAQGHDYDKYKQPLNTFLRLKRINLQEEKRNTRSSSSTLPFPPFHHPASADLNGFSAALNSAAPDDTEDADDFTWITPQESAPAPESAPTPPSPSAISATAIPSIQAPPPSPAPLPKPNIPPGLAKTPILANHKAATPQQKPSSHPGLAFEGPNPFAPVIVALQSDPISQISQISQQRPESITPQIKASSVRVS